MSSYSLSATVIGADELKKAFLDSNKVVLDALSIALNQTANDVQVKASELAPHKTGALKDSLHAEYAKPEGNNLVARVGTNSTIPYARAQEYGTVGMTINGKSKLGNRFTYIGNIKAKLYMKKAKEYGKPLLTQHMQAALSAITKHLAGE